MVKASLPDGMELRRECLHGTPAPASSGRGFEWWQGPWDPKGGELYL